MTKITIAGGVYSEICASPNWHQVYGSAGRAAIALSSHVKNIKLFSYAHENIAKKFKSYAQSYGVDFEYQEIYQEISFKYLHCLSTPYIFPSVVNIKLNKPLEIEDDVVIRFGMMEGSAVVNANYCIYDPQSAFAPEAFHSNGSKCEHLAVVANAYEIKSLTGHDDAVEGATKILKDWSAKVVIVKCGEKGAYVVASTGVTGPIFPWKTDFVWTIGSGDVFTAAFGLFWGVHKYSADDAAYLASLATANYVNSMSLPFPDEKHLRSLSFKPAKCKGGKVYLAGPFFDIAQLWLIEEALRTLQDMGMEVFSPLHDIGIGPAHLVAPADIKALTESDVVFALLDGIDSGTWFEVGYARSLGKPVFALAQRTTPEELKMVQGSGCNVYDDFVTAIHALVWRE